MWLAAVNTNELKMAGPLNSTVILLLLTGCLLRAVYPIQESKQLLFVWNLLARA